ncbi:MAG: hypothetical protein EOO65_01580 [Methanosarcinales archaeon]|nr:MAG: hypothetical protein EOO65_01580 [Methanosarcinales archaeon]
MADDTLSCALQARGKLVPCIHPSCASARARARSNAAQVMYARGYTNGRPAAAGVYSLGWRPPRVLCTTPHYGSIKGISSNVPPLPAGSTRYGGYKADSILAGKPCAPRRALGTSSPPLAACSKHGQYSLCAPWLCGVAALHV